MKKKHGFLLAVPFILAGTMNMIVQAGNINGAEAGLIGAASGTFEYNGKLYVAGSSYLGQLQAKLSEDGVDLTEAQAANLAAQMYASVGEGVAQGILVEVGNAPSQETDAAEETSSEETNSNDKKKKKKNNSTETTEESSAKTSPDSSSQNNQIIENNSQPEADEFGETLRADSNARNYNGFDLYDIYNKSEEERTAEEQAALDEYISKTAVEKLMEYTEIEDSPYFFRTYGVFIIPGIVVLLAMFILGNEIRKRIRAAKALKLGIRSFTDIHSHILPGVDDGSPDMETTVEMIEKAYAQGVRAIIATPHYMRGQARKTTEELQEILQKTRQAVSVKCPDMELYPGNEILYSESIVERLHDGRILTLANSRYILIEFRRDISWSSIYQAVVTLLRERYIPVIAHAERYKTIVNNKEHMEELHHLGAMLQINAGSVIRFKKIIRKGYIDFLATDCHDLKQRKYNMKKGVRWFYRNCNPELIQRILVENPDRILKFNLPGKSPAS